MGHAVPQPSDMFSDTTDPVQITDRFEQYKGALSTEHQKAAGGGRAFAPGRGIVDDPTAKARAIADRVDSITKSISPDVLSSVQGEIDALKGSLSADIGKDWALPGTLSGAGAPNNAATLVPYDLEAPAKLLVPRLTPLRNRVSRGKGQGTARQFRRILGWSNAGIGGVADKSPFFDSQTDTGTPTFGSLALRRGQKIEYASDNKSAAYVEMSLSDQVNWVAQFAGQGYQDLRSLSQTALLWAHLGGEERALLYGRGSSGNGYSGSVSAPTVAVQTATTGGTIGTGVYKVIVTALTGFGTTAASTAVDATVATSTTGTITLTITEPAGSLGVYNVYVGTVGGAASTATLQQQITGNTVTLTALTTTGGAPPAADSSFQSLGYDGFLTVQSGSDSGYYKRLNANLSNTVPGDEFQDAFLSLYQSVKADPDHIWCDAGTARDLGDLLKTAAGNSSYRLQLNGDNTGHFLGSIVTGIENQVTRKMVPFEVHPWMPKGNALIQSLTLPIPDSNVSQTSEVISVQEYMSVDWPVIQATYDSSTYWYGTLVHYAPAWSGLISNIVPR